MEADEAHEEAAELNACTYLGSFSLEDESCCEGIELEQLEQLLADTGNADQPCTAAALAAAAAAAAAGGSTYYPDFMGLQHISPEDCVQLYSTSYASLPPASSYGSAASTGSSSMPTSPQYSTSDTHSPPAHAPSHAAGPSCRSYGGVGSQPGISVTSSSKQSPLVAASAADSCPQKKRKLASVRSNRTSVRGQSTDDGNEFDRGADVDTNTDDGSDAGGGGSRTIKWHLTNSHGWHKLLDKAMTPAHMISCQLDADKGINYSALDSAFISQKKNHFQVTCTIAFSTMPRYVVMHDQTQHPIDGVYLHMYGVKKESPTQLIKIEQSQADRSKKLFDPMLISLDANASVKLTIPRLHFMETTNNNMRKKGKPNPDQRYFQLVVGLYAHSQGAQFPFAEYASDKIIVRASNPGQFESEPEVLWQKGAGSDAIYHYGQVGINSDRPDEALVVNGNVKVMGRVLQPSDERVKSDIMEVDTREQLARLAQLRMYHFKFREEFGNVAGLSKDKLSDTGVLAQQLYDVLPDAVHEAGDVVLSNGELVENLLVVNKERLFMESVGAVKELCKVTETLGSRVDEIEKINSRLALTKRSSSVRSAASSTASSAAAAVACCSADAKDGSTSCKELEAGTKRPLRLSKERGQQGSSSSPIVSRRVLQNIVISLVVVMCLCLGAIVALYLLEKHTSTSATADVTKNSSLGRDDGGGETLIATDYTTSPAACNTWSLITAACASAMYSCPYVCGAYDVSATASNVSIASLSAATGTVAPGFSSSRDPSGGRRRRRSRKVKRQSNTESPVWPDLFDLVSLTVTDSKARIIYNLTRDECLTCDIYCSTDCSNYSVMLFTHTSFPVTDLVYLHFNPGPATPTNRTVVVATCGLSLGTGDGNSTCNDANTPSDTLSSLISLGLDQASILNFDELEASTSSALPKAFVMPVGRFKRSTYKFRIGYKDVVKDHSMCSVNSTSSEYIELNVNVVRTNYRCIDSLVTQIQADLAYLYFLQVPQDAIHI